MPPVQDRARSDRAARSRFHELSVARVDRLCDDAAAITFVVPAGLADAFAFRPGQSVTLRRILDGREERRSYSICAPAGEPLRIGVREVANGVVSSWLVHQVRPGDRIEVLRAVRHLHARPRHAGAARADRSWLGYHAGPVDRRLDVGLRQPGHVVLWQPAHRFGDVRRRDRRSEGRRTDAASSSCTCCRANPKRSSCSAVAWTPRSSGSCFRRCGRERDRSLVAVRPVRDGYRRDRGPHPVGRPGRAGAP